MPGLLHPHPIKVVAWDVDETLVRTFPQLLAAHRALWREVKPREPMPNDEFFRAVIGLPPQVVFKRLRYRYSPQLHERFAALVSHFSSLVQGVPGAQSAVRTLKRMEIKNALETSRVVGLAEVLAKSGLILGDFACIRQPGTRDRRGEIIPGKPSPAGLRHIAAILGVQPWQMAMVGDAQSDMIPAIEVGALPVGMSLDNSSLVQGARLTVTNPYDVVQLVLEVNQTHGR